MAKDKNLTRREFIQNSAALGAGVLLTGSSPLFAAIDSTMEAKLNIKSKGYAAIDTTGRLVPWEFERRPVGDNDVLIDIKYASICHSDIHQMKGHWGKQQYPQVPGHEIVGVVVAIGKKSPNSRSGTGRASAVWSIAVWSAKAARTMANSTARKPNLPMVTPKKALRPAFPRGAIRPISLYGITSPYTFPLISVSRKPHRYCVQASRPIHPS